MKNTASQKRSAISLPDSISRKVIILGAAPKACWDVARIRAWSDLAKAAGRPRKFAFALLIDSTRKHGVRVAKVEILEAWKDSEDGEVYGAACRELPSLSNPDPVQHILPACRFSALRPVKAREGFRAFWANSSDRIREQAQPKK